MSKRRTRISRLRDLADTQELAARTIVVRSQNALRSAEQVKVDCLRKTEQALRQDLPISFRGALSRASLASSARQDDVIRGLQNELEADTEAWDSQRQRAGSLGKLFERIDESEKAEHARIVELELADVVTSRFARPNNDQLVGRS